MGLFSRSNLGCIKLVQILYLRVMPQRKIWTTEEDDILKYLRENQGLTKWSLIAKKMCEEHGMPIRTGKQCRERYHNHLDSTILRSQWTREEEQQLYNLHQQIGNKWAIISQKLPGRTDNCVKNHFYSKMRKALRKLNRVIHMSFRREIKQIKMTVVYKIIQATDEKFKNSPGIDEEISERCSRLQNMLLEYSNDEENAYEHNLQKLAELAQEIHEFSGIYRRKPKRSRRNSMQYQSVVSIPKFSHKIKAISDDEGEGEGEGEGEDYSEGSNEYSHDQSFEIGKKTVQIKKQLEFIIEEQEVKPQFNENFQKLPLINISNVKSFGVEENQKCIESLLKNQGLLKTEKEFYKPESLHDRNSERADSVFSSQDEKSHNMLSESIEKMKSIKLGDMNFQSDLSQMGDGEQLFINP